jgi:glycosyltransferase involved in cell wall biosynthesis
MKVLITASPEAFAWTYVTELAGGLEREGVELVVAILNGPLSDHQRAQLRTFRNVRFFESTYHVGREADVAGEWLLDLADQHDVDIVHLNETSFAHLPWRTRTVLLLTRPPASGLDLSRLDALVTPTRTLHDRALQHGTPRSSAVIPLGRSQAIFAKRTKEPMILTSGDYDDANGNVAAVARVATRISWPVFILGAAPPAGGVSLANSHFLGIMTASDSAAILSRASVFAQPARSVVNSYDIIDAATCGCALVLGDVAELREQWDGAATFVDPDDEDQLRSTLIWLMSDTTARNDLASRAQHRVVSFTAEQMASAYLALYVDLSAGLSWTTPGSHHAHSPHQSRATAKHSQR